MLSSNYLIHTKGEVMRMAVYSYYSLIEKDEDGAFIVTFPDLDNVFTDGSTLKEAVEMAEDVLGLMLGYAEDQGETLPTASKAGDILVPEGVSLVLITVDTDKYKES